MAPRVALVVDDDAQVRRALTRFLESDGWLVVAAGNVTSARKILTHGVAVDVVVADWSLPGERDDERPPARQILALATAGQPPAYRPIPVILLTGRTDLEDEDLAGFLHVVTKLDIEIVAVLLEGLPSLSEADGPESEDAAAHGGNGAIH